MLSHGMALWQHVRKQNLLECDESRDSLIATLQAVSVKYRELGRVQAAVEDNLTTLQKLAFIALHVLVLAGLVLHELGEQLHLRA